MTLLGIAALVAAVLGYGAWRAHGHAYLSLVLNDLSLRDAHRVWGELREGQLVLRDSQGTALAAARFTVPDAVLRFEGPGAVDCAGVEAQGGAAWQRCTEARLVSLTAFVDAKRCVAVSPAP